VGKPNPSLPYDSVLSGSQMGSWIPLSTNAQGTVNCVPGGGINAVTGSLVTITGMTGTFFQLTNEVNPHGYTQVYSPASSCGQWVTVYPSTSPSASPTQSPTFRVTSSPTAQVIIFPSLMAYLISSLK